MQKKKNVQELSLPIYNKKRKSCIRTLTTFLVPSWGQDKLPHRREPGIHVSIEAGAPGALGVDPLQL